MYVCIRFFSQIVIFVFSQTTYPPTQPLFAFSVVLLPPFVNKMLLPLLFNSRFHYWKMLSFPF